MVDAIDPNLILEQLILNGTLSEDIQLNSFSMTDGQITLDVNEAFQAQLKTYGTTGEIMMMGSVVNTFLDVYEAETVLITANGQFMESGHAIYDFPMGYING